MSSWEKSYSYFLFNCLFKLYKPVICHPSFEKKLGFIDLPSYEILLLYEKMPAVVFAKLNIILKMTCHLPDIKNACN